MELVGATPHPSPVPACRERNWVAGFCLFAGLHVFLYAAAFPFFGNVDETAHFDTVVKYARGHLPRSLESNSDTLVRDAALYGSSFYSATNDIGERMPPPWTWPAAQQATWIAAQSPINAGTNYQSSQPPLYYAYTAAWWRLGGWLGIGEGQRLYGLRFLNIPLVMLLVWLGWLAAREVLPDNRFGRLAVPGLLAVMPQSAFYSIENDALVPLFFGIAFIGVLRFGSAAVPRPGLGLVTGLALAAAFLTKMTSAFPILVVLIALGLTAVRWWRAGKLAATLPAFLVLATSAGLPALAWMTWCKINFHDLTGSRARAEFLGWTAKPLLERWHHPIFTAHGAAKFLDHFLPSFWQGELVWHLQSLSFLPVNWVYTVATMGLLALPLIQSVRRPASMPAPRRRALWLSFFIFGSAAVFLVWMSISFDFHDCPYPSRDLPYMVSGRLALATLIPFMVLLVSGLDLALGRLVERAKFTALGVLLGLIVAIEAASNWQAFADPYNWFHL
jgi:hypothetical protein